MKKRAGEAETPGRGEGKTVRPVSRSARPGVTARQTSTAGSPRYIRRLITLLTDFGTTDYFVGAMKGVILSLNPDAEILNITHEVPPQDIRAGAFTLLASYQSYPPGTIHVGVVDPGVGSSRRAILITTGAHTFVGPDNGIFSYVCERQTKYRVFHLTNEEYFRQPVSPTFHGRDVFAPVAAALAAGVEPEEFGPEIADEVRLESLAPQRLTNRKIQARIIHVDHFGNCITNLTKEDLPPLPGYSPRLKVNGTTVKSFRNFFADKTREKLFALWGSAGFLELAAANLSAARMLKIRIGQPVVVEMIKVETGKRTR